MCGSAVRNEALITVEGDKGHFKGLESVVFG